MKIRLITLFIAFVLVERAKGQGDCPFGIYGSHQPDSCICLNTGLWRVSKEYCSKPLSLVAVSNQSEVCFYNVFDQTIEMLEKVLTFEGPEVAQLSSSMQKLIKRFNNQTKAVTSLQNSTYQGQSTLITFGASEWTLTTAENESYCLVHNGNLLTEYCVFPDLQFADKFLNIESIETACEEMLPRYRFIQSSKCHPLNVSRSCEQALAELDFTQVVAMQGRALNASLLLAQSQAQDQAPLVNDPVDPVEQLTTTTTTTTSTTTKPSIEVLRISDDLIEESSPQPLIPPEDLLANYSSEEINREFLKLSRSPLIGYNISTAEDEILDMYLFPEIIPQDPVSMNEDMEFYRNLLKRDSSSDRSQESETSEETTTRKATAVDSSLLEEDEDSVPPGLKEIGHKLIRDQIDQYVDTVVAGFTGLLTDSVEVNSTVPQGRYPLLKLLDIMKMIMQRTCSPVKADYFEMALHTFVKLQLESFRIKEPYLSPEAFRRIEYALKRCYNEAKPHPFFDKASEDRNGCGRDTVVGLHSYGIQAFWGCFENQYFVMLSLDFTVIQPKQTTSKLDIYGNGSKIVKLDSTPPSSSGIIMGGGTATREPLTETVWKMVINAHSYCYPYFKAYFNDHQTLTVAFLPLFNNQIQDIWLKTEGYDTSKGRLYGGLLGDTYKLLEDVDNCVAASRYGSQYPWYMSRPMKDRSNKWRRRRAVGDVDHTPSTPFFNKHNQLCMFQPDDPVAFLGKQECS